MVLNQKIKFVKQSRYGDWNKDQEGTILGIIALPPENHLSIYIVDLGDKKVWATGEDIIAIPAWTQLTLF